MGREHTCAWCGARFQRGYNVSAKRAARPQLCGAQCQSLWFSAMRKTNDEERFCSRVKVGGPDECWVWTGSLKGTAYGWFKLWGRPMPPSRAAYSLSVGSIPSRHEHVCHACDNPPCCNPAHLWLGSAKDNIADMDKKGRRRVAPRRGELSNKAKLTREQAIEVYHSTEPPKALAARFGVSSTAICLIRKGQNWAHATGARNEV